MSIPKLTNKAAFEAALNDYHMSSEAENTLITTPLVLMVAATSTGRNTIINTLLESGRYHYIVSDTTRPIRMNNGVAEQDGKEYFFRSEEEMLDDLREGKFIEAALIHDQQVSGISAREIAKAQEEGRVAITDVEIKGADHIVRLKPDTIALFVLPPSFEEWLDRIRKRTVVSDEELQRRLKSAIKEFKHALDRRYYLYIINDDLENAIEQVDNIARFNKIDQQQQAKARDLLEDLLVQTTAHLEQ